MTAVFSSSPVASDDTNNSKLSSKDQQKQFSVKAIFFLIISLKIINYLYVIIKMKAILVVMNKLLIRSHIHRELTYKSVI